MTKLALIIVVLASFVGASAASATQPVYLGQNCGIPVRNYKDPESLPNKAKTVRPASYYANCASRFPPGMRGLRWKDWGSARTVGTGKLMAGYEDRKDFSQRYYRVPGRVVAWRPRYCPDGTRIYTRVSIMATGKVARRRGGRTLFTGLRYRQALPCWTDEHGYPNEDDTLRMDAPITQGMAEAALQYNLAQSNAPDRLPDGKYFMDCTSGDFATYDHDLSPEVSYTWSCDWGTNGTAGVVATDGKITVDLDW
jgi:hypothetical protein